MKKYFLHQHQNKSLFFMLSGFVFAFFAQNIHHKIICTKKLFIYLATATCRSFNCHAFKGVAIKKKIQPALAQLYPVKINFKQILDYGA